MISPCLQGTKRLTSFIDNLLVSIHFIIEMMWWTGLAPRELDLSFPVSLISSKLYCQKTFQLKVFSYKMSPRVQEMKIIHAITMKCKTSAQWDKMQSS